MRYLTADEEKNYIIAQAKVKKLVMMAESWMKQVIARHLGENIMAKPEEVDFIEYFTKTDCFCCNIMYSFP